MANLLSDRIAELRKERGLTQEQLGQLVGVSAQAVSKWEKGGAPDVELLPTLADRLGVTIDTLFGRSQEEIEDMTQMFTRWLEAIPAERRPDQLFRLLSTTFPSLTTMGHDFYVDIPGTVLPSCYTPGHEWLRSLLYLTNAICMAIPAEDFPFYMLLPEPQEGYASQLASDEEYRRLFSALSIEGSLELLRYLYRQKEAFYSVPALANRVGLPQEQVNLVVEALTQCNLLHHRSIELEEGSTDVYIVHDNLGFVPFLYLARWLMEKDDSWVVGWYNRKRPILVPPGQKKED
ncbi:MAG: helix-turn-helix transcriptional regulator [Oscillospiraceae bacterium]|nr:helix-turn-helix transcriptional regulator [Oscillospiraceae bacterium]MDE7170987.1 helix-turn-helix transcriptional regulator [Oscillospiraceae bacterium]